ncbi:MAG: hypothetical protein KAI43_10505 [Candidatus Aureabacteria bacterium]|nr:hypothetical protein [Candidatus Auribacterota bacterium]
MVKLRKKIASLARKLYAEEISFKEFLREIPEQDQDDLVDELVDLIEHEPIEFGFLDVSEKEHDMYIKKLFDLIKRLEKETT